MTKKFTEEQYQKIVNLQEDEYRFSILEGGDDYNYGFWRRLIIVAADIASFANENKLIDELAALANPLTREWAHDQFVEKEKKFCWTSKKKDKKGFSTRIVIDLDGLVRTYPTNGMTGQLEDEKLTESEIKSWGYNPDMFDREEVKG